jgi:lipoprotein signal peptidase
MILYLIIAVALIIIDQLTKAWTVTAFEYVGETIPVIQDFFHFLL